MMDRNNFLACINKQGKCKIGILSLGCPRNLVDSESILGRLDLKGYPIVDIDKADIGIVNTCAFIEEAKTESIDAILDLIELKKQGSLKKIIVYGCLSQRYKIELSKALPEVDAFVGILSLNHDSRRFSITPKHYAYLKICDGCINNCSYCTIPKIKQRFSSLDIDSIINKAEALDKTKISEINIIGQDISGYGVDLYKAMKFPTLLSVLSKKVKNARWLRLLYLYPRASLIDEILDIIKDSSNICRYIDLPIQHINNRILKLMNRGTAKKDILKLIEKVRKKLPQAALRTSLIVGFPSETDKEFRELLKAVEDIRFERLGAFIYSREYGTSAYNFKRQLPQAVKIERFNQLMSKQQKVSQQINKKFLNQVMDVLIDEQEKDVSLSSRHRNENLPLQNRVQRYLGRSQYDAPDVDGLVFVSSKRRLKAGDFVKVKITDTLEYDLVGEQLQ